MATQQTLYDIPKIKDQLRREVLQKNFYALGQMKTGDVDEEKRTICFTFSSEEPVKRGWYKEVLDHSPGACNLTRLNQRAPLLLNHDENQILGSLVSVDMKDKGIAIASFSSDAEAEKRFNQVKEGHLHNVSVRYSIDEFQLIEGARRSEEEEPDFTLKVTKWTAQECSLVAVPADPTVGIGRSLNMESYKVKSQNLITPNIINKDKKMETSEVKVGVDHHGAMEAKRCEEIIKLATEFERTDLINPYLTGGKSLENMREELLRSMKTENKPSATFKNNPNENNPDMQGFSLVKAINASRSGRWDGAEHEGDVIRSTKDKMGKSNENALYIPYNALRDGTTQPSSPGFMGAGASGFGSELVGTDTRGQDFIDLLTNQTVLHRLGADRITGLNGDILFPSQTGAGGAHWIANEGDEIPESKIGTGAIPATPKTLSANRYFSNKLLAQSSVDIERIIKKDITTQLALALDIAGLYGGAPGSPGGIVGKMEASHKIDKQKKGINFRDVVSLESRVSENNCGFGRLAYVAGSSTRGILKSTDVSGTDKAVTGRFIWQNQTGDNGTVNGYPAFCSNQVAPGDVFFGKWDSVIVCHWGVLKLVVDHLTGASRDLTRIIATQYVDIVVTRPEGFAMLKNSLQG